ncbi:unnamed protein product [Closterium sp. NIES-53]
MWNSATLSPTTKGLETTLHKGLHEEKCYTTQRSSLYTLTTAPPPVPVSSQVAASSQVFAAASRSSPASAPCSCRPLAHETLLWHHHLGHPSLPRLRGMASRALVSGLPRSLPPLPLGPAPTCVPCVEGRQRAAPHSFSFPPTEAPLQTLHMDVWGPACVRGQGHERYFLLVIDDYSRYTTVFPLRSKDKGGEFSSDLLRAFCRSEGIRRMFTLPASPQQNGIAERHIGMVMDVAPDKLSSHAVPCVFLGFPPDAPGLQFYHPTSRHVLSSQDVTFDESVSYYRLFPYRTASPPPPPPLFLALGTPLVDPLPPQGPAPSGVSQVDPAEPVKEAVDSGAARGADPAGAGTGGAESGGAETGCAEPGGLAPEDTVFGGAEPARAESGGAPGVSSRREPLSPQRLRAAGAGAAGGAGGATRATGGAGAAGGGAGAGAAGGAAGAGAAGGAGGATRATGGAGAAGDGAGAGGAGGAGGVGSGGAGGVCQRSSGDPRLILGKGYMLVVLGVYGRTDPLLNKPFYPNSLSGWDSDSVGVEVTPVEDTAASSRQPRPASPLGFLSVPRFPPRSSLRVVVAEPGGVRAGGSEGPEGVGGGGAGSGAAGGGGTSTVAPTPCTEPFQTCPSAPSAALTTAAAATVTAAPTYGDPIASLRVLAFDHDDRPLQFDTWLYDLQLYLLSDSQDSDSLFDLASSAATTPPATADSATPHALYAPIKARNSSPATAALGRLLLPYLFPELPAFATVEDLVSHLRTSDARYRTTVPAEFLDRNQPPMFITLYFIVTRLPDSLRSIRDHFLSLGVLCLGDCYWCVPPDPGIAAAALGASESGASAYFFRDSTTLTPLSAPVPVRLADPSGGPVVARSSTLLPCPAVPSGSLSSLHLPHSLRTWVELVHTPYRAFSNSFVAPPPGSRLQGMHSRLLVTGLPRSLPPLPPSPAPPCLPSIEKWQRAAPHSSSFPPTRAPLQTLHMDVWNPARVSGQSRERYFLLVVDDYMQYTTVFPLRSKDRGGEFSSNLLRDFCCGEGILQSFTLADSPQQKEIVKRCIGLVLEVARTSMIHAAAPHFVWPFAVRYAAHQLNLSPRVSLSETSPTLRWTGEVGDALVFRFYHPTLRRVFPSQDVTFDESVPFYRLFPYRSAPPPPPPLFLAPGPHPIDPLLPQGPAPPSVSHVDPLPGPAPVPVAVGSGAARGAASGGVASGGAEPGGAGSEGAGSGGAEPGDEELKSAEPVGVEPEGAEPGGAESEGARSGGAEPWGAASSGATGAGGAGDAGAGGARVTAGAGGTRGIAATGPRGARTRGIGAAGTGGVEGTGVGDPTELGVAGAGGTGAGGAGAGGVGAAGAGAIDPGAGGAGDTVQPRPYFSQLPLQPASPLPAPSPYTELFSGLTEHREPVCTTRRVARLRPLLVPGTHAMALCPSSLPLRVPLPAPPDSSLLEVPDPESDRARVASPTVARLLATAVTDPSFESAALSALVVELLDFAAA